MKVFAGALGLGCLLTAPLAMAAQPEPTPQTDPLPPPPPRATVQTQGTTSGTTPLVREEVKKDDGVADHEKVVGKFGVMYFGINSQPIGSGATNAIGQGNVPMPVIGVRYWMRERLGLDLGLGLNFFSSSTSGQANNVETTVDGPAVSAFAIHGGVPLAIAYGKHYKFLVVPELNFGYATQTVSPQGGAVAPDVHFSGIRVDAGARVGTEIQFGFIGIPELALQASVGLNFRHQRWSASQDSFNAQPEASASTSQTSFGTTVQSDPWALFTNNIAAIYYFP